METYLTRDVRRSLEALLLTATEAEGLLLGHTRGSRFMVERILPLPSGAERSRENLIEINGIFEGALIGWFTVGSEKPPQELILQPYMTGKLWLRIRSGRDSALEIEPFVIVFRDGFKLDPIPSLISDKSG